MKGSSSFDGKLTVCKQKQLQANGTLQSALLGVQGGAQASPDDGEGRRCCRWAQEAEQAVLSNFSSITRRPSETGLQCKVFCIEKWLFIETSQQQ